MSDFWKRVDEEIEYKGINRAFLAKKCNFSVTNIGQGIKLGSTPSAETAVKIAAVLGVSVEYLVTGEEKSKEKIEIEQNQLRLYRKHSEIIKKCEELSSEKEKLLVDFLDKFAK
ncbi:MAG: helix-turn-helix transcriptional regulator [Treponema sp.]|uniref:helix-turn-helix domain-containing protein n=1 Tax=Treponema sp. TaxID=166 RepID=UPI0025CD3E85|nr:helix-turn-helix transcriptional regulator [Treponema sp.]MBQ9282582.1 helix-turn-helix transcriptional regulator [Treponema sp.]